MACFAYVADRTPAQRRMLRITLLELCVLVAGIVSPIGIGPIIGLIGVENVILSAICLSVINFGYVFLFLCDDDHQEHVVVDDQSDVPGQSYSDEVGSSSVYAFNTTGNVDRGDRHLPRFRRAEPRSDDNVVDLSHSLNRDDSEPRSQLAEPRIERQTRTLCDGVRRVVSLFLSPGRSRAPLNILMAVFFISALPSFNMSVMNLFEMNQPLCWTITEIGLFTGITIAISAVGALIITPLMKKCATDWHIAMSASVAAVITNIFRFFVRDSLTMYLCEYFIFCFFFFCCGVLFPYIYPISYFLADSLMSLTPFYIVTFRN